MERIELRSTANLSLSEDELFVEGLVNKTNTWSEVLGSRKKFREKVLPGVFSKAIEKAKRVDFLSEHNKNLLLATTDNHSLDVYEDNEGLQMRAKIAPTSYGKDIYTLIKEKIVAHMSFG
ncbi:HK97 family phage prohead protease, partial [Cetobacterium sp.]|uniref:HK97 family phage prohead protease n=1 Tax=Cetobacterium sp. TaxID=2071632 RepID=UPI003EE7281D